jgi:hypothetical protein
MFREKNNILESQSLTEKVCHGRQQGKTKRQKNVGSV